MRRTKSGDSHYSAGRQWPSQEPGRQTESGVEDSKAREETSITPEEEGSSDEQSSLLSSPRSSKAGDVAPWQEPNPEEDNVKSPDAHDPHLDIRGLALLKTLQFWQQFAMMGLLTGIGLMTIK